MSFTFRPTIQPCAECGIDTELSIVTVHDPEVGVAEEQPICLKCLGDALKEQIEDHARTNPEQFETFDYEEIKTSELLTEDYAALAINFRHATIRIMRTPIFNTYGYAGTTYSVVVNSLLTGQQVVGIIHPLNPRSIASVVDSAMVYISYLFAGNKYPEVLLP